MQPVKLVMWSTINDDYYISILGYETILCSVAKGESIVK